MHGLFKHPHEENSMDQFKVGSLCVCLFGWGGKEREREIKAYIYRDTGREEKGDEQLKREKESFGRREIARQKQRE